MSSNMTSFSNNTSALSRLSAVAQHLVFTLLLLALGVSNAQAAAEKFTMELNDAAMKTSLTGGMSLDLSTMADITGGTAEVVNPGNGSAEVIDSNQSMLHVKLSGGAYVHIRLNKALKVDDVISFESRNPNGPAFYITTAANTTTSDYFAAAPSGSPGGTFTGSYKVKSGDAIVDKTDIYLHYKNGAYIRKLTITPITYTYTLKANVGDDTQVISTGTVGDEDLTVPYPLMIKKGESFYVANGYTPGGSNTFGHTFNRATNTTAKEATIDYTQNTNIKGFLEGENADYAANAGSGNYSNGDYGFVAGRKAGIVAESLAPGNYTFYTNLVSNGHRAIVLRDLNNGDVATNTLAAPAMGKNDSGEKNVTFTIYGTKKVGVTGYTSGSRTNQSADFDYAYIKLDSEIIPVTDAVIKDQTVDVNGEATISPTFDPTNASNKNFTMTSSDPSVVSVDNTNHKVKGLVAGGSAVITVIYEGADNLTKTFNVFVKGGKETGNLTTIESDFTFTPTSSLSANTLYEENKILSIGSNSYNSGGVRVKSTGCAIAFKVNEGALIKVTFSNHTNAPRTAYIHNALDDNNPSNPLVSAELTNETKVVETTWSESNGQVIYLYANNSDMYVNKIEVFYNEYTVTYKKADGTQIGTATEASPTAGVTLPDYTPGSGYVFAGWSTNSAAVTPDAGVAGETYHPTSDITLYAVCIATQTLQSVTVNGHTLVADNDNTYSYTIGTAWDSNTIPVTIPVTITPAPTAKATVGNTTSNSNGQAITVDVPINGQPQEISVSSGSGSPSTYYIKVNSASDIIAGADHYAVTNTSYYEGQKIVGTHITAWISTKAGGNALNSANSNYGELATTAQTYNIGNGNWTQYGDINYSYRIINSYGNNPVFNAGNGTPSSGAYYAFRPTVDGVLEVSVNIANGKQLYISNGSKILTHGSSLATADYITSFPLSNGATTGNVDAGSIHINVSPNTTYYIYGGNTKMGLLGFALNEYYYLKTASETFTLSEENLNNYAFFTKENAETSRNDYAGVTIYRVKKAEDKLTVKVRGAGAAAGVVYNSGGSGRIFNVQGGSWTSDDQIAGSGETTSVFFNTNWNGYTASIIGGGGDVYGYQLIFLATRPAVITIKKDKTEVTSDELKVSQARTYTVSSNQNATTVELDDSDVSSFATVTLVGSTLTITPNGNGSGFVRLYQEASAEGGYEAGERLFFIQVEKQILKLEIKHGSYDHYTKKINNNTETHEGTYYSGSTATSDGGTTTGWTVTATDENGNTVTGLSYQYYSDDLGFATVNKNNGATTIQNNASGTAYVTVVYEGNDTYAAAKAQYSLTISDGYDVKLTNNHTPTLNQRYEAKDASNNVLCTMIACGYKYNSGNFPGKNGTTTLDSWGGTSAYSDRSKLPCQIDGFIQQSQASKDSQDERANEIEWVSDDKNRVKVFSLPVHGAYLKFEPEVNGVLTAYVLQNGDITTDTNGDGLPYEIGKAPRAYYWFDQDGYRLEPVSVTSKLPLCYGRDYTKNGRQVFFDNDNTNGTHNLNYWYGHNEGLQELYEDATNPMWPTQAQVDANLKRILPDPQPMVRYNNGYSIHQKAYVKYVLNVVAGNTYYFFSNVSKLGMAGFNFKPTADGETITYKTTSGVTITASTETAAKSLDQTTDVATTFKTAANTVKVYKTVTFDRTFKVDTWNTITLPFPLTEKQVEDVFGKGTILVTYNGVARSSGHNTAFFLRHVDQNILAGQPYFIKPTGVKSISKDNEDNDVITYIDNYDNGLVGGANNKAGITFHNVNCDYKLALQNYERDSYNDSGNNGYKTTDLQCVGTLAKTDVATGDYFINVNSGDLVEYTGGGTQMNAYRAFLKQSGANQVKLTSVNYSGLDGVDWEAEATGIMEVLVNDMGVEIAPVQGVFNLNGQKVGDSTKGLPAGLYIVNGKVINIK